MKSRTISYCIAVMSLFAVFAGVALAEPQQLPEDGRDGSWSILAIDDFNGDGQDDLLWGLVFGLTIVVEIDLMDGSTVLDTTTFQGETGYELAGSGDVTSDGVADLIWYQRGSGLRVYVLNDDGLDSGEHHDLPLPTGPPPASSWEAAAIGDFDGDGDADVYWRSQPGAQSGTGDNEVHLLEYGVASLSVAAVHSDEVRNITGTPWKIVGAGDIDGDGDDDVLWQRIPQTATAKIYADTFVLEEDPDTDPILKSTRTQLWAPGEDWEVRGFADLLGDGNADAFLRNEFSDPTLYEAWMHELGLDANGKPDRLRASRYDARAFEDPSFELAGLGDLDGDGNADTVWQDADTGEVWVWFTRRLQAVHFKPRTQWGDQNGVYSTQWILGFVEDGVVDEQHVQDVRSELQAIKAKTGLRQIKIELGVGKTFSFPEPTDDQLDSVVDFFELLGELNMTATMNIGNNCWAPDSLLKDDAMNPTPRLHIAGQKKGDCYQSKRAQTCSEPDPDNGIPGCTEPGCTRMKWDMADECRDDPDPDDDDTNYENDQGWITDSRTYYDTILGHLVANVPDIRKRLMFFNINGSAVEMSPSEPGMFNPNMWGPPDPDDDDPYADLQEAVRRYYLAVYDVARKYPIPIGMKSNPNHHDGRLRNVRLALGDVVEDIDFWDFTSRLTVDLDEILDDLELSEDWLPTMALTDFGVPNDIPSDQALADYAQCFFDEVEERGLLGWWFQTFRFGGFAGLLHSDSPIGAPETDPATVWQEAAVSAIRHDLHYFDGTPGVCTTPIPQP